MKPIPAALLLIAVCVLAGCESLDDAALDVREKFSSRVEPRTKTFASPPRVVYEAVKMAASRMDYRFVRGGPAQGEFEAVGGIQQGEATGSSQQIGIKVHLHASLDGASTEVSVRFTEILEADSSGKMGMATESTMRDTPLYEVFFRNVQQALQARPTAAPVTPVNPSAAGK